MDDWNKLKHLIEYLRAAVNLPLILGADGTGILNWYVDASFAVYANMRGHTGGVLTMGQGCPIVSSTNTQDQYAEFYREQTCGCRRHDVIDTMDAVLFEPSGLQSEQ